MKKVLKYAFVIASLTTVSMAVHLFAALGADSLADGEPSLISRFRPSTRPSCRHPGLSPSPPLPFLEA